MRKAILYPVLLLSILILTVPVSYFWLTQAVKLLILETLTIHNYTVDVISFNPFSRHLEIIGLRGKKSNGYSRAARVNIILSWPVILLNSPLHTLLASQDHFMTIGEKLEAHNISAILPEGRFSVQRIEADAVLLNTNFVSLAGKPESTSDNLALHLAFDDLRLLFCSMDMPGEGLFVSINTVMAHGWRDKRITNLGFDALSVRQRGADLLKIAHVACRDLFFINLTKALADPKAFFQKSGDFFFSSMEIRGFVSSGVELDKLSMVWTDSLLGSTRFSGLKIPSSYLSDALLSGISKTLIFDGECHARELGQGIIQTDYAIASAGLGELQATSRVYLPSNLQKSGIETTLLSYRFSDIFLRFTDKGLMARLALSSGDPAAFAPILGMAAGMAIDTDKSGNQAILDALLRFVARPGVLELRSLPGKQFTLLEAGDSIVQKKDPAALFWLAVSPGQKDLNTQAQHLTTPLTPAK